MTYKQPEALRLADRLEADAQGVNLGAEGMGWEPSANNMHEAAAELRRLHEVNVELVEALDEVRCDIRHMLKGHFVHLKDVEEELSDAIAKATGEQQ